MTTTHVIVQTSIQSSTGLPKDQFENVWHFLDATGADPIDVATTACDKIGDFWTGPTGISGVGAPSKYLGTSTGNKITLIAYDFAAATPRPELGRVSFDYTPIDSTNLPEEVALCLSYYTDRNLASHRGRLYLGPFNTAVLTADGEPPVPNADFISSVVAGATRLITIGEPATVPTPDGDTLPGVSNATTAWALYSPKLATFAAIEHGWVDNEWDGQRRRRVEATARVLFP